MSVKAKKNDLVLSGLLFSIYIFVFLLTESTINDKAGLVLSSDSVNFVYAIGLLFTCLGYLSFYTNRFLVEGSMARKMLLSAVTVIYTLSTVGFIFISSKVAFLVCSFVSLLTFGYVGAFVHYIVSLLLFEKGVSGRVVGSSVALATVLQFVIQNLFPQDIVLIVCLVVSVFGILFLERKPVSSFLLENPLPYSSKPTIRKSQLVLPIAVVALMSVVFGFSDGIVTTLHANGVINLSSYSRLLYATGIIVAGFAADIKRKRLLPLCTICLLFVMSVCALFVNISNTNIVYVCAIYLFSGFYVMHLTLSFLQIAPLTDKPELWAGMGRIVRCVVTAFVAIASNTLLEYVGQTGVVILGILFSVLTLVLFVINGDLNLSYPTGTVAEDKRGEFLKEYNLTPRESEVFEKLIDDDFTNKEIAEALYVSTRVVERYISSIYEKTGVKSRVALVKLYYSR